MQTTLNNTNCAYENNQIYTHIHIYLKSSNNKQTNKQREKNETNKYMEEELR